MIKKEYQRPDVKVILFESSNVLAGSRTGATGEDVPWAAKQRGSRCIIVEDDFYWDEE